MSSRSALIVHGMHFLGSVILPALLSGPPQFPIPVIEVSADLNGITCDIPRIYQHAALKARSSDRTRHDDTRSWLYLERLPDSTWNIRVYLYAKLLGRLMGWSLHAATCERAVRRSATKLVWTTESLFRATEEFSIVPPIVLTLPPVQRPSVVIPPAAPVAAAVVPEPPAEPPGPLATASPVRPTVELRVRPVRGTATPAPRRRGPPLGLRIRGSARMGHGVLPQTVFGGGQIHAALVAGRARLELGAGVSGAGKLLVPGDDETPRPTHASLQLNGCGELTRGTIDVHLCLGFEGGRIFVAAERSSPQPWTLHLTGSPALTWWFARRIGLYAGITAGPALVRSNFYTGPGPGADAVGERKTPSFLLAGSLGLELRVPKLQRGNVQ